jgi:hypothetical protein
MSITPVGSSNPLYSALDSSNTKRGATPATSQGSSPSTSDTVTLSPDAQAMASLNAKGITMVTIHSRGLSSGVQPPSPSAVPDGLMSKSDFEAVTASFGVGTQQADQDFAAMDSNGDGSISHSEMLSAMSATSQGSSSLSKELRQMMDTNDDGSVSSTEFINLETAFVGVEK